MSALFDGLNDVQRQAASHLDGPLVVFAGAGSGKTRIITTRIAYLIERGVRPWEILAVTFTNKAAGEMKARIEAICPEARRSLVTTFHSACARWLREFAGELGFNSNFTIYDDADSTAALKKIIKARDPKAEIPTVLPDIKGFLAMVKTRGLLPADAEQLLVDCPHLVPDGAITIYRAYQEFLADCNAMDFGDLLMNMLLLLRHNKTVRGIMQSRYRYVLVDEYQDTNRTQFELIHILTERHGNLFVVGDDDQSIYSWRGATPSNILDFNQTYPKSSRIALEQNYRCTANIVNAASAMIAHNKTRAAKTLFTKSPAGELIDYRLEIDGEMEAWWVVKQIQAEKQRYPLDDIAIFYRTNSQSRVLEEALRRENVPYTIYGSVEFYDRLEIKDLLAYLKLLVNESDEIALRRVINVPTRGIGDKAVELIEKEAIKRNITMIEAARQMAAENFPRLGPKLKYFVDLIAALRADLLTGSLDVIVETLLDALEYPEYLKKKYPDQYADKLDNIHELGSAMAEFQKRNPEAHLEEWLQTVTLIRDESNNDATKGVSLMTLHMAKGLEFRRVYLVGLEEGLLPHRNSMDDLGQLEEERRLLYVGITRAKEKLSLLSAYRRRTFNSVVANPPSRFLKEIPEQYLRASTDSETSAESGYRFGSAQREAVAEGELRYDFDDSFAYGETAANLSRGTTVIHPTYGKGQVEGVESTFGKSKVIVNFRDFGLRKIRPSQLRVASSSLESAFD